MKNGALRVAAYFLVAHFIIAAAIAFLGTGSPDYFRMFVSFGFLLGSVFALFAPRKLGWLMVVAYTLHTLSPLPTGMWAVWNSTQLEPAARIVALVILSLMQVPLLVALVLIFKPGSFAAFKSPPAGDVAKEAAVSKS